MSQQCQACHAATDASLCPPCTRKLETALRALPKATAELEVCVTRQDRMGGHGASAYSTQRYEIPAEDVTVRRADAGQIVAERAEPLPPHLRTRSGRISLPATPLPFGWDASRLASDIRFELRRWATPFAVPGRHVYRTDAQLAAFLISHLGKVRKLEDAGEILDGAQWLVREAERLIDRRDPDVYAGRCDADDVRIEERLAEGVSREDMTPEQRLLVAVFGAPVGPVLVTVVGKCGAELYGRIGEDFIRCRTCGKRYDIHERKADLLAQVDDHLAPAEDIAHGLTSLDLAVTASQIRVWVARKKLIAHSTTMDTRTGKERALYRVGDVRELVKAQAERDKARPARRSA